MFFGWDDQLAYMLNIFSLKVNVTVQLYNNIFQLVPAVGSNTSFCYFSITKCGALPNPFSQTRHIYFPGKYILRFNHPQTLLKDLRYSIISKINLEN